LSIGCYCLPNCNLQCQCYKTFFLCLWLCSQRS